MTKDGNKFLSSPLISDVLLTDFYKKFSDAGKEDSNYWVFL